MVGNRIYRQTIGMLNSTDCTPLLANLFLFFYEYRYMKDMLKTIHKAKKFSNTMR